MTERPPQSFRFRRLAILGGTVLLVIGAAMWAAVYGIGPFQRNAAEATCRSAVELAQKIAPLARGEVAAMIVAERPMLRAQS